MNEQAHSAWRWARVLGRPVGLLLAGLVGVGVGVLLGVAFQPAAGPTAPATAPAGAAGAARAPAARAVWTCSMHPEVRRSGPGQCPKCAMALIPAGQADADDNANAPPTLAVSQAAAALLDVELAPVERRFVTAEVRTTGKVHYDETKLASITAWMPGRLERLFVDYTGVGVRKGDHLVEIYSAELLSAQAELLQALRAVADLKASDSPIVRETAEATVTAAREKLRLLGITPEQVAEVERTGKASDRVTLYSPASGIVIRKHAREGMYVGTGTRIYTIADLARVWVKLDAYESDLMWLRYGQKVEFTTVAYPGQTFRGTISLIDPVLDERTRTVKVRVIAANADGRLKPGMFVKAVVRTQVAAGGRVMAPDLAGKWISPMHPEIVKDGPGTCDVCGMPLVRTESLGYVSAAATAADKPLVIPASAPLVTGTRAVVYVRKGGAGRPTFEGREVALGLRAGDYYLVRSGLAEGERVVARGAFKIDSALQILARPSMMSPQHKAGHKHE